MVCGGVEHAHNLNTIKYRLVFETSYHNRVFLSILFPVFSVWRTARFLSTCFFYFGAQNRMTRSIRECLGSWAEGQ